VIRQVMGERLETSDVRRLSSALNEAVALKEVEGHIESTWTPPGYSVQADLGEITGAQASIYAQARAALAQALPLLNGLEPLGSRNDADEVEALRAIVRTELVQLVNELGVEGGPRVGRVDLLFDILLGADAQKVDGQLDRLHEQLWLDHTRANTLDEEQNLTNFLVLVDYVSSLKRSWSTARKFFKRAGGSVFLAEDLVQLTRSLKVVAESVRELYGALDSVALGPSERRIVRLGSDSSLTVADLLAWVEQFASDEGPRLIRDAGKVSAGVIHATLEKLAQLVCDDLLTSKEHDPLVPYRSPRVQQALAKVSERLKEAKQRIRSAPLLPAAPRRRVARTRAPIPRRLQRSRTPGLPEAE